jgi:hypothetical protein
MDDDEDFAAGLLRLIDCLEPCHRLIISRVPIGDGYEDYFQLQAIPPGRLSELQSIIRRKTNGD